MVDEGRGSLVLIVLLWTLCKVFTTMMWVDPRDTMQGCNIAPLMVIRCLVVIELQSVGH